MSQPIHTKIINKVAKSILTEYGIKRKGQSRTWLDDQYWYTTVIEFQPFKNQEGTYLNVGANFHWFNQDHFSFDLGNRESGFIEFTSEAQFEKEMNQLVELVLTKVLELRTKLSNLDSAEKTILNYSFSSDELWGNYHRAVICGLNKNIKRAENYFGSILKNEGKYGWIMNLKQKSNDLNGLLKDLDKFKEVVNDVIERTRADKRLPKLETKYLW